MSPTNNQSNQTTQSNANPSGGGNDEKNRQQSAGGATRSQGGSTGSTGSGSTGSGSQQSGASAGRSAGASREDLSHLASAAVEEGRQLAISAQERLVSYADRRKSAAAESLRGLSQSVRKFGEDISDRPSLRELVEGAADVMDRTAQDINERDLREVYESAEDFARARPVAVALGAMVLGLAISRLIKSSSSGMEWDDDYFEYDEDEDEDQRDSSPGASYSSRQAQQRGPGLPG
jgi:hypothetical protein